MQINVDFKVLFIISTEVVYDFNDHNYISLIITLIWDTSLVYLGNMMP